MPHELQEIESEFTGMRKAERRFLCTNCRKVLNLHFDPAEVGDTIAGIFQRWTCENAPERNRQ